jgi:hypothetical protein
VGGKALARGGRAVAGTAARVFKKKPPVPKGVLARIGAALSHAR